VPPDTLVLPFGTVHLWEIPINRHYTLRSFQDRLTYEECQQLDNIVTIKRQQEYAISRVMMRHLVGKYLGVSEKCVTVKYLPNRKPKVITPESSLPLHVSLSHSDTVLLMVFARHDIGVDVERIREAKCYPLLAKQIQKQLSRESNGEVEMNSILFTRCWTAYEAVYKLYGVGTLLESIRKEESKIPKMENVAGYHVQAGEKHIGALASSRPCELIFYSASSEIMKWSG